MALDMYGSMSGWSMWMMTDKWDLTHRALLFAMWAVMMIGMMLPSATPALFLYAAVLRKSGEIKNTHRQIYAFAAGYLVVWTLYSLLATVLQVWLARWLLLTRMMEARNRWFAAALLIMAGVYQLTPLKQVCLKSCRSPVTFLTKRWRRGTWGGFRMGVDQGLYCLGCCWALMLLLFVGGVMNLWWIAGLTAFVLLEKFVPLRIKSGRLSGMVLLAIGAWTLIRR